MSLIFCPRPCLRVLNAEEHDSECQVSWDGDSIECVSSMDEDDGAGAAQEGATWVVDPGPIELQESEQNHGRVSQLHFTFLC